MNHINIYTECSNSYYRFTLYDENGTQIDQWNNGNHKQAITQENIDVSSAKFIEFRMEKNPGQGATDGNSTSSVYVVD